MTKIWRAVSLSNLLLECFDRKLANLVVEIWMMPSGVRQFSNSCFEEPNVQ